LHNDISEIAARGVKHVGETTNGLGSDALREGLEEISRPGNLTMRNQSAWSVVARISLHRRDRQELGVEEAGDA
jgi:hypothetical protein